MLTIGPLDRQDISRRGVLRIGGLGLTSLALSGVASPATAAATKATTGKSVIFLYLSGGPSQFEFFDPKMSAPEELRSVTGEVATKTPGITFGGTFPQLAQRTERFTIVRSFTTGNESHNAVPLVGPDTLESNLGAIFARIAGASHPATGMPANVLMDAGSVEPQPTKFKFDLLKQTSGLDKTYAPFVPGGADNLQQDMKLNLPLERFDDRRALLAQLDAARQRLDADESQSTLRNQAARLLLDGVAKAFDLAHEEPRVLARYDTSALLAAADVEKRWPKFGDYIKHARSLGKLLLLARRLCDAGCGFVTVTAPRDAWDMHGDQNNVGMTQGMRWLGPPLDHAVAALLDDLKARGQSENILLVMTGEMGRTPKITPTGGRDHWGALAPLLLAGGGLKMGQVIGRSTRDGGKPATDPITARQLIGTIFHTLFDVGQVRLDTTLPRPIMQLVTETAPIPGLH